MARHLCGIIGARPAALMTAALAARRQWLDDNKDRREALRRG
jgi:hypothetical protein